MTTPLSGTGFGGQPTSSAETRGLRQLTQPSKYANKDFVKNLQELNEAKEFMASYMLVMQRGIDEANQNAIEQIQGLIADIITIFAGFEPTGIDLGDLKYIFQGLGAIFGIQPDTPFPLNLFDAVGYMVGNFFPPLPQFTDLIFDAMAAWAEALGFSDEAVDSIQEFNDAVISLYLGIDDLFGELGDAFRKVLELFGLGSSPINLGPLEDFWNTITGFIGDILSGPRDTLLAILSSVIVAIFKTLTWLVNMVNPQNWLNSTGLNALGEQLAPAEANDTNVWVIGVDPDTTWVFDSGTDHSGSRTVGSFKTNGTSTAKRFLSVDTTDCVQNEQYLVRAQYKWDSIPTGDDAWGACIVFYNGLTEVSQTNINIDSGHGTTGGFSQYSQTIVVPAGVDNFKIGCRVTTALTAGTVWVDDISVTKYEGVAQGIANLFEQFLPWNIFQTLIDGVSGLTGGVVGDLITAINDGATAFIGFIHDFLDDAGATVSDFVTWFLGLFTGGDSSATLLDTKIPELGQSWITDLVDDLGDRVKSLLALSSGTSLVYDPRFTDTTMWGTGNTSGVDVVTTQTYKGDNSLRFTADGSNYRSANIIRSETTEPVLLEVEGGDRYYFEVYYYVPSTNSNTSGYFSLRAAMTDSKGVLSTVWDNAFVINFADAVEDAWTKASGYITIESGGYDQFRPYLRSSSDAVSGDIVYYGGIVAREVSHGQSILDSIVDGLSNLPQLTGIPTSFNLALNKSYNQANLLQQVNLWVEAQKTAADQEGLTGAFESVEFTTYSDQSSVPDPPFSTYYDGDTGSTGYYEIVDGVLTWHTVVGDSLRQSFSFHDVPTDTYNQRVGLYMVTAPNGGYSSTDAKNGIIVRAKSDFTDFGLIVMDEDEIWLYRVTGTTGNWSFGTALDYQSFEGMKPGAAYWVNCDDTDYYKVYENSTLKATLHDTSGVLNVESHKYCGFYGEHNDWLVWLLPPGDIGAFILMDNVAADYKGVGGRWYRTNTTAISCTAGTNTLPASHFVEDYCTDDYITADLTNNKATVKVEGHYRFSMNLGMSVSLGIGQGNAFAAAPHVNGNPHSLINETDFNLNIDCSSIFGSTDMYLYVDDYVQPGYYNYNTTRSNAIVADSGGLNTWWSLTLLNPTKLPTV